MNVLHSDSLANSDEMADPGLHAVVMLKIAEHRVSREAEVLVLGAGRGNLDRLLLREGYKHITAVDINAADYVVKNTTFVEFDLNRDFDWDDKRYDLVLCVEIIEHVENTVHFLREVRKKMHSQSIAIITTPNTVRKMARLSFLLFGRLPSFDEKAVLEWGHINPIFPHIIRHHFGQLSFCLVDETYNRKDFDTVVVRSPKSYVAILLRFILSNLAKLISLRNDNIEGVINIYTLRLDSP